VHGLIPDDPDGDDVLFRASARADASGFIWRQFIDDGSGALSALGLGR
jgi:hypothetical protein